MALVTQIQEFLKIRLKEKKFKRTILAYNSGIPYSTISKIFSAVRSNPELMTVLKIANYFNCSMDEVVARNNYALSDQKKHVFLNISSSEVSINLKSFLKKKSEKLEISLYTLSKNVGSSEEVLPKFMKNDNTQKILGSAVTVALADYFQVSLDEMIGRIKHIKSSEQKSNSYTDLQGS